MLFITSRMPTVNTEPELNKNFVFDLSNNASGRAFFCCRRKKKNLHEEIGSKGLLTAFYNVNLETLQYKPVTNSLSGVYQLSLPGMVRRWPLRR